MAYCEDCGEECYVVERDEGIGAFEFQGERGVDRQLVAVSRCCEAEAYERKVLKEPYEDGDTDPKNYNYFGLIITADV